MKKTTLLLAGCLALAGSSAKALSGKSHHLSCHSHRGEKFFRIQEDKVSFIKRESRRVNPLMFQAKRESANTNSHRAKPHKRFHKTLIKGENTYYISIDNPSQPNPIDDYLTIENKKGHRISYALFCRTI